MLNENSHCVNDYIRHEYLTPSASTSSMPDPSILRDDSLDISRLAARSLKGVASLSASPLDSSFVAVFCITRMKIQIQEFSLFKLVLLMLVLMKGIKLKGHIWIKGKRNLYGLYFGSLN